MSKYAIKTKRNTIVTDPPIARLLFDDTRFALVWMVVRIFVAWTWLQAALQKLSDPTWMQTGEALKGFWTFAVQVPAPPARPPIAYDWYRSFLQYMLDSQSYVWFAKLIAVGELLIAVGLILGVMVGITAFFAGFMNWNYIMAGSASVNGMLLVATFLLILAWKTAGYFGVDRFLLHHLGVPWEKDIQPISTGQEQVPTPA